MKSQIESLNRDLDAIKRKPKEKKKVSRKDKTLPSVPGTVSKSQPNKPFQPGKQTKKPKKADDSLSFEQKKELSETIQSLDGEKLEKVIQIIHDGVPEVRDVSVASAAILISRRLIPFHRARRRLSLISINCQDPYCRNSTTMSSFLSSRLVPNGTEKVPALGLVG